MRIVLLGAPGAGKGTQAALLSKTLKLPHISTGDIFRSNLRNHTSLGNMAKDYMDRGLLVPDKITVSLVRDRIKNDDCKTGFILDGFPRTLPQAEGFDQVLTEMGIDLDFAIDLDVADEEIIRRIAGRRVCPNCGKTYHIEHEPAQVNGVCDICQTALIQRTDDKKETVLNRLHTYHEQTEPLREYYRQKKILKSIDATKEIEKILADIIEFNSFLHSYLSCSIEAER